MLWGQRSTWGHLGYSKSGQGTCRFCDTTCCLVLLILSESDRILFCYSFFLLLTLPASAGQGIIFYRVLLLLLLLLSSSFCQHVNISETLHSNLTKPGLNDQYLDRYSHTNNDGVKGHGGVTGVKKVKIPKLLFLLQITWYGHVTHAYSSARYPLQKLSV